MIQIWVFFLPHLPWSWLMRHMHLWKFTVVFNNPKKNYCLTVWVSRKDLLYITVQSINCSNTFSVHKEFCTCYLLLFVFADNKVLSHWSKTLNTLTLQQFLSYLSRSFLTLHAITIMMLRPCSKNKIKSCHA